MDITKIKELIGALESSGLYSLDYQDNVFRLALSKGPAGGTVLPAAPAVVPAAPMPESATVQAQVPADDREKDVVVTAPLVGTVYRSRDPQGSPLVSVGDTVEKDQALCLIEAMKMYSEVTAPCKGIVREILFDNGALAEYGTPLVRLEEAI